TKPALFSLLSLFFPFFLKILPSISISPGKKFPLQRCAPKGHTTASFAAVNSSNKTRSQDHTFLLTLTKYPVTFL
ncbi:hypothetical protein, partial [Hominenteromicrobium sp.]|uniref:hypothetical protein n=1 Tax=Hominenteromicrobium sp. TaxID=3073581 RepID=UPI003AACC670